MAVALLALTMVPLDLTSPATGLVSVQARPIVELVLHLEELLAGLEYDEINFLEIQNLEAARVQAQLPLEALEVDCTRAVHQVEPLALETFVKAFPKASATPLPWEVLLVLRVALEPVLLSLQVPDLGAVPQD